MHDRRKEQRVVSMFKGAYVRNNDGLHFVTLRNISETGLCFDAFPGVEVGAEVEFCFDSAAPKTGVVRWVRDGRFGVSMLSDGSLLPHEMGPRPRAVRLPLSINARVHIDGRCSHVTVHNLSLRGICVDHVSGMRVGQLLSIEVGGHSFELATIRWHRAGRVGIRLAKPIQLQQFRDLVKRLQDLRSDTIPNEPEKLKVQQGA